MNDLKKILDRLAEGSDKIIANPETIEKLRSQGLPIKDVPSPTISELFDQRKEHALQIAVHLPSLPEEVSPTIQTLYQEIRECIFFGCNGAAITLSGILIEFMLKRVTYAKESGGYQKYDPKTWDEFEDMDLSSATNRAKRAGILDSRMAKRINAFRKQIRNPYSHYNIQKISEHVIAEKVKVLNTETGEHEERDLAARDNPFIQTVVKPIVDKYHVLNVFHFADEVVKYLSVKI